MKLRHRQIPVVFFSLATIDAMQVKINLKRSSILSNLLEQRIISALLTSNGKMDLCNRQLIQS